MPIAGELLESARQSAGISRRALARLAGASNAGLVNLASGREDATTARLDGLLRHLDTQLAVLPTRRTTVSGAAAEVAERLNHDDRANALRAIWTAAADLAAVDPATRVALAVMPPAPTGDSRFDALLAAVVDQVLTTAGLPIPTWVRGPERSLADPWDVEPVRALQEGARAVTPDAIRRHGIWLDPAELVNA